MLRSRPNKPRSEFARVLAEVLAAKKLDFAALAKRLGIASSSVYRVVRGQQRPPLGEDLDAWIDALGVSGPDAHRIALAAHLGQGGHALRRALGAMGTGTTPPLKGR